MNETLASFGLALAQLGALLALAPGLNGLIKRMKAVLQGRKGPPLRTFGARIWIGYGQSGRDGIA